jgi:hypothetical protein
MERPEGIDPALALNRHAQVKNWPLRCDSALSFERPELNAVRDIWRSLAAGKNVPPRTDFDARTLKPYLRNISIIERVPVDAAKWRYRYRLMGTAITEVAGENTGHFLDERIPPKLLPRWTSAFDAVLDNDMPMRFVADFQVRPLDYLHGEAFAAPLADERGETTLILTCLYLKARSSGEA